MFNALPGPGVAFIFKRVNAYRVNKIFARNIPMSLNFFVTDRCNAACDHCFFWKETDGLTRDEFSINKIDTLAAGLKGLQQVLLTGGEPFLREDLNQICEKFLHHGVKFITIPTNGILTRRIVALGTDVARHKNLETLRINISLDGLRDGHDAIRNVPGCYDQALETIHRLKEVSHIYPKLQVSVLTTLSQKNISGLKTFIETVNKLNIPLIFSIVRGANYNTFGVRNEHKADFDPRDETSMLSIAEIEKARRIIAQSTNQSSFVNWNIFQERKFDLSINILKQKRRIFRCLAGYFDGVIYSNGDVSLCELTRPIANLNDFDMQFDKLWWSEQAERMRAVTTNCCCLHGCNILSSMQYDPETLKFLVSNFDRLLR